ncbi:MAG: hypothetical protein IPJ88_10760 [Myxococcales bacterium]|nr:MAG: hypothetical protein IPJ88_10760 [Myxococcales bacterium]
MLKIMFSVWSAALVLGACMAHTSDGAQDAATEGLLAQGQHSQRLDGSETVSTRFQLFADGQLVAQSSFRRRFASTRQSCAQSSFVLLNAKREIMYERSSAKLCLFFSGSESKRKYSKVKEQSLSVAIPVALLDAAKYLAVLHHRPEQTPSALLTRRLTGQGIFKIPAKNP